MSVQENTQQPGNMLKWLWLSLLVLILDQITKISISQYLVLYESIALFPGINLTLAHNTGAAFSFLADQSGWQRWFFTAIAVIVSIVIVLWIKRLKAEEKLLAIALALVLGGALGNVWDRLYLGYVIDFIDVYYQNWHWPAFNVADSAISVGAVLILIDAFFIQGDKNKS